MSAIDLAKVACTVRSTVRCTRRSLAGLAARQLLSFQFCEGRIGRAENPPPQFGHTFCNRSTQRAQNVHSKEQIIASIEFGGNSTAQFSQRGLSSSMAQPFFSVAFGVIHHINIRPCVNRGAAGTSHPFKSCALIELDGGHQSAIGF